MILSINKFATYIFLLIMLVACDKGIYHQTFTVNCTILRNGIISSDADAVISEINKLLYDLKPAVTAKDPYGHEQNIDILIKRINSYCATIRARLVCYACIETNPPQSEIELTTSNENVIVIRILDIWTSSEDILRCRTVHENIQNDVYTF